MFERERERKGSRQGTGLKGSCCQMSDGLSEVEC